MSKNISHDRTVTKEPLKIWALAAIGFLVSIGALVLAIWFYAYQETLNASPKWYLVPPISQNSMFEVVRNAVTTVAALGVGVTLFLSFRRQHVAEQTLKLSVQAQLQAGETLELTRQKNEFEYEDQLRSRYSKAAEQIGSVNAALVAAGIISMRGIGDAWDLKGEQAERDACIRMIVAALPDASVLEHDAVLIRSTMKAVLDERMTADVGEHNRWRGALIDLSATASSFGPISGWILNNGSLKLRCNQLALKRESRVVQDLTIDRGVLNIKFVEGDDRLQLIKVNLRDGRINLLFDGGVADETTVVLRDSKFMGGMVSLDEPNDPVLKRKFVLENCTFDGGGFMVPIHARNYEFEFQDCEFRSNPFLPSGVYTNQHPQVRLVENNRFKGAMQGFPHGEPSSFFLPKYSSIGLSRNSSQ